MGLMQQIGAIPKTSRATSSSTTQSWWWINICVTNAVVDITFEYENV
jgi:hypothetical protein